MHRFFKQFPAKPKGKSLPEIVNFLPILPQNI